MTRKFNDRDRWKSFRKIDIHLKQLYDYCWDMADAIGVYEVDFDYLKLDTGYEYSFKDFFLLMEALPEAKKIVEISPGKFLFIDFIEVVYEKLKEGYNPHKPAFRALKKHKLEINSSLNQALFKLVNENEYEKENELNKKESGILDSPDVVIVPRETKLQIFEKLFGDELYVEQLAMTHKGKDIKQAFEECYTHHSNAPNAPRELWEWRQKLNTWLTIKKIEKNGTSKKDTVNSRREAFAKRHSSDPGG